MVEASKSFDREGLERSLRGEDLGDSGGSVKETSESGFPGEGDDEVRSWTLEGLREALALGEGPSFGELPVSLLLEPAMRMLVDSKDPQRQLMASRFLIELRIKATKSRAVESVLADAGSLDAGEGLSEAALAALDGIEDGLEDEIQE